MPYSRDSFNEINQSIFEINNSVENPIEAATIIIGTIEEKIAEMHLWLKNHIFSSTDDEIRFFKEIKPKLISKLIYYSKIIEIESNIPDPKNAKIRFLKNELDGIVLNSKKNKNFNQYYRSGSTHHDHIYFIRSKENKLRCCKCQIINYDSKVNTCYDNSVAQLLANNLIVVYLENKLEQIKNPSSSNSQKLKSNLNWTASKIDLIELIYALQESGAVNSGASDLKELADNFGKMFNVDIDEGIYRTFKDIKSRKINRTKFLNSITENLNQKILEEEY